MVTVMTSSVFRTPTVVKLSVSVKIDKAFCASFVSPLPSRPTWVQPILYHHMSTSSYASILENPRHSQTRSFRLLINYFIWTMFIFLYSFISFYAQITNFWTLTGCSLWNKSSSWLMKMVLVSTIGLGPRKITSHLNGHSYAFTWTSPWSTWHDKFLDFVY